MRKGLLLYEIQQLYQRETISYHPEMRHRTPKPKSSTPAFYWMFLFQGLIDLIRL